MLTQCPSCQTTFRVTSEILRVAYGQVRCGRCQTQFDATERLIEETDDGGIESGRYMRPPRHTPPPRPPRGQIEVEEPIQHEDITLEGRHIEISGTYPGIDQTGSGEPRIREEIVEEWVEIEAEDADAIDEQQDYADAGHETGGDQDPSAAEDVSHEDEPAAEDVDYDDEDADSRQFPRNITYEDDDEDEDLRGAAADVDYGDVDQDLRSDTARAYEDEDEELLRAAAELEAQSKARSAVQSRRWAAPEPGSNFTSSRSHTSSRRAEEQIAAADDADDLDFSAPRSRRQHAARIWSILAPPLMLLLTVQVVHNYRATLARHPTIGAPLQSIYSALGMTLRPDWNLHAYEVKQWGVISDPATPGTLKVRASVKNLADFAQPYPLLKLVLEDRWGEQVRAREFEPAEYLDPTIAPDRMLAPAQQLNATIAIVDPGPDAEGFRFDVCLRGKRGPVCAADVPGQK